MAWSVGLRAMSLGLECCLRRFREARLTEVEECGSGDDDEKEVGGRRCGLLLLTFMLYPAA